MPFTTTPKHPNSNNFHQKAFFFDSFKLEYKYMFLPKEGKGKYLYITDYMASSYKRLQYNKAGTFLQYLIIDCDNNKYIKLLKNSQNPQPNFVIQNKEKAGAHLIFILDRPILANQYFNYFSDRFFNIFNELTELYEGDKQHKGYIGKNYLNTHDFNGYMLNTEMYSLQSLEDILPQNTKEEKNTSKPLNEITRTFSNIDLSEVQEGERNISLFNELRKYAYVVKSSSNLLELLEYKGEQINEFLNLPSSEIKKTVKSVHKYFSSPNFKELKKKREKMTLSNELSTKEKQKLGAEFSAKAKKAKTELRIEIAIKELNMRNEKITITSLVKITKMSKNTIKKYRDIFKF